MAHMQNLHQGLCCCELEDFAATALASQSCVSMPLHWCKAVSDVKLELCLPQSPGVAIMQMIKQLTSSGINSSSIGVICFFRAQV